MKTESNQCPRLAECLTDYLDDTLSDKGRQAFTEHLAGCAVCRLAVERARTLQTRLQTGSYLQPPESVYQNVLHEIRTPRPAPAPIFGNAWALFRYAGAFAVIALIALIYKIPKEQPPPNIPAPISPIPTAQNAPPTMAPVRRPKTPAAKLNILPAASAPSSQPIEAEPEVAAKTPDSEETVVHPPVRIVHSRRDWEKLWYQGARRPDKLSQIWEKAHDWIKEKGVPQVQAPQAYGLKNPENSSNIQMVKPPQVNFKEQMVIALPPDDRFAGAQITQVLTDSGQISVFYRTCSSVNTCTSDGEPFNYQVIPKSDLPVVLKPSH